MYRRKLQKSNAQLATEIQRNMDKYHSLPFTEREIIQKSLDDIDGEWVYEVKKNKPCIWMRFTLPAYFILYSLTFIFMPFKYLLIGEFYYDPDHGYGKFLYNWHRRLFGWYK